MYKKIKEPVIIYNPNNKLIKDVDIKEMLNRFSKVKVTDIELYRQSLTQNPTLKRVLHKTWTKLKSIKIKCIMF